MSLTTPFNKPTPRIDPRIEPKPERENKSKKTANPDRQEPRGKKGGGVATGDRINWRWRRGAWGGRREVGEDGGEVRRKQQDGVAVVFGCWTSASRKAVLPVFEELNGLLFYPVQYEGLESSPNIFYTGAEPTQQIIPGVDYLVKELGKKKIYLLGSDYVFPRTANLIIKAQLEAMGVELAGEEYVPLGGTEFSTIISKIQEAQPAAIFNTLNGDSNVAFFKQFKDAGFTAESLPVMSVSVAEEEVRGIGTEYLAGHFTAWNYYQTSGFTRKQEVCRSLQESLWRRSCDQRPGRGRLLRCLSVEGNG